MPPRILIVDDEPLVREVLRRHLERKGCGVEEEEDAEGALGRLANETFDLILLDNNLPGMMGLTALAQIKDHCKTPILIMSGHCDEDMAKDAGLLGASGAISKPIDGTVLYDRIRALLGT
jgi:DNA-binding response OmpR family regulator